MYFEVEFKFTGEIINKNSEQVRNWKCWISTVNVVLPEPVCQFLSVEQQLDNPGVRPTRSSR